MSNLEVKNISLEELNRLIEKNRADIAALQQKKKVPENKYHASVTTTSNFYLHMIQSADDVAANTLNDILSAG